MANELKIEDLLQQIAQSDPPDWVREAQEHYRQTGYYRPEDLRRIAGDPTQRVELRADGVYVVPNLKTENR
ncbi:MAG: hypothetical protein ACLQBA_13325 [Candidatus Binataceae bacterium]